MQIVKIGASFIFSNACTKEMLWELAAHPFVGYTQDAIEQLAVKPLKKGSPQLKALEFATLRTCIVNKLQNNPDINEVFKTGNMEFEFAHLQDPDINNAGANKQKRASSGNGTRSTGKQDLTGAYVVVKQGVKCSAETDAGKWAIWQHIWACNSFEQYFQTAPAKGVTKTQRVITARSEILWAVKCGWIKPVAAQQ